MHSEEAVWHNPVLAERGQESCHGSAEGTLPLRLGQRL